MARPHAALPTDSDESPTSEHHETNGHGTERSGLKRRKVTRACDSCKSRKRRCTGELPCHYCRINGAKCTYLASYTRGRPVEPIPASARSLKQSKSDGVSPTTSDSDIRLNMPISIGLERPTFPRENSDDDVSTTFAGLYQGPASGYSFIRRAWRRFETDVGTKESHSCDSSLLDVYPQSESVFAWGDSPMPALNVDYFRLPKRSVTSQLMNKYFDFVMPTFRYLHCQTILQWLSSYHQFEELDPDRIPLLPARRATVLFVLAVSCLFDTDEDMNSCDAPPEARRRGELYFQAGKKILSNERGRPRLESVQARIIASQYMLHVSRPNQAWYLVGTTAQMMVVLGMHRATPESTHPDQDFVTRECRKRTFWSANLLDTYLSVILGRPPFIALPDTDQDYPDIIDDEDLTPAGVVPNRPLRDSKIMASVLHVRIVSIVKGAVREQYSLQPTTLDQRLTTAERLSNECRAWRDSLPAILSGKIDPTTLSPVMRRQIIVLRLAYCHAMIVINRPALLYTIPTSATDSGLKARRLTQVEDCIASAHDALQCVTAGTTARHAFWFPQYVTFSAISVVYVWLILREHEHVPPCRAGHSSAVLFDLAVRAQATLREGALANAPGLRYTILMDELRLQAARVIDRAVGVGGVGQKIGRVDERGVENDAVPSVMTVPAVNGETNGNEVYNTDDATLPVGDPIFDLLDGESFPFDPDLWLQIDSFPYSDLPSVGTVP